MKLGLWLLLGLMLGLGLRWGGIGAVRAKGGGGGKVIGLGLKFDYG